jgi:hypothetical protein
LYCEAIERAQSWPVVAARDGRMPRVIVTNLQLS